MPAKFQIVTPRLHIGDKASAIKKGILAARAKPLDLEVAPETLEQFAPRLEGNWGQILSALPEFYADLLAGNWRGDDSQSVPTSLLGDFGEFLAAEVVRQVHVPRARIARIVRPSGDMRPDFLCFDPAKNEIVALEAKARTNNAERLRAKAARRSFDPLTYSICSEISARRREALEQISSVYTLSRPLGSGKASAVVTKRIVRRARVSAHRSAIATPFIADGRFVLGMLPGLQFKKQKSCPHTCSECLRRAGAPMVLLPLFFNSKTVIEPMVPKSPAQVFEAYMLANKADWAEAAEFLHEAFSSLLHTTPEPQSQAHLQPLLDMVAFAADNDWADAGKMLKELEHIAGREALTDAVTLHDFERGTHPTAAMAPGVTASGSADEVMSAPQVDREGPKRGPPARTPPAKAKEVELVPPETWLKEHSHRSIRRPRDRASLPPLLLEGVTWETVASTLRRARSATAVTALPVREGQNVWLYRAPLSRRTTELRVVAKNADDAALAAAQLLALSKRPSRERLANDVERYRDDLLSRRETALAAGTLPTGEGPLSKVSVDGEGFAWITLDTEAQ
ncbi:hypothetical protein [Hyalangium rubrum]|uniref:Uncharacterized protein n=1 Tax=Hyalangium rubrum TaxID=3103134 RepID=A0ABU5HF60_9BACT|nr:hypothetical protein [Hyalangium sp. s54d21]MDY7232112.1 hypothetical protein [Hyalangium sp. s54d21]